MTTNPIVLNQGQKEGADKFALFFIDPTQKVLKLKGRAGTGKTTLIKYFLDEVPNLVKMQLLLNPEYTPPEVFITATTNQAAEVFCGALDYKFSVTTIHRLIGVRVERDYKTGQTNLVATNTPGFVPPTNALIILDEAGYGDKELRNWLFLRTVNCKFLFIGDDRQQTPVGSYSMPLFDIQSPEIHLTNIERQSPGPLQDLCDAFWETVGGGPWPKIQVDNAELFHMDDEDYMNAALKAFREPEVFGTVKMLAYTNNAVIAQNKFMSNHILGTTDPQPGQRMQVNSAVVNRHTHCATGEEVLLEHVMEGDFQGVDGWFIQLRRKNFRFFMPKKREDHKDLIKTARAGDDTPLLRLIDESFIDLRPAFACTVAKAQGSTFDTVFIDLDNIGRYVRQSNQLARTLYVAFSRARSRVIMRGDL